MLERCIINHASATLAGIKPASLINYKPSSYNEFNSEFLRLSEILAKKGVILKILSENQKRVLLYIYRKNLLDRWLNTPCNKCFLERCGYKYNSLECLITKLSEKIPSQGNFPHEVGLFLGYPLCDVIGYMTHSGDNYKCCKYWKVYAQEEKTKELFNTFDICKKIYQKSLDNGMSLDKLCV